MTLLLPLSAGAQTQVVRGTVTDRISKESIPGVGVTVLHSDPLITTTTDENGNFRLEKVPVGKQSIRFSFDGYYEIVLQAVNVNAGKELVLNIEMEEDIRQMQEVEITAKTDRNKPLNEMSTVSTRNFSVEETQRYAAAVNDPARMATSFAGVVSTQDGNNTISIRGNSPNGLLWRMEGVEIPNPNHFSNAGTSGGGISILSAQLLTNSDFSTGAFAAEYGNALSGVFDLKLRKGNNEKREYTVQAGIMGIDVATEGPFKKGYAGSYLINYRYSTLNLLNAIGIPIFESNSSLNFQDLSFNVSLPTKKAGTFGVFGLGGLSIQTSKAEKDSLKWAEDEYYKLNTHFISNTGAVGLTHIKLFGNQSYLKTALVVSGSENGYAVESLSDDYSALKEEYEHRFLNAKNTLSSVYTKKFNARSSIRTGIIVNRLVYSLKQAEGIDTTVMVEKLNIKGNTFTSQAFAQWQYKINNRLTTNIGVHGLMLFLNNSWAVEPRASARYAVNEKHFVSLGYGMHSQVQPVGVYFARINNPDGSYTTPNHDLELNKAHHVVLGYDWNINEYSHIKTETYYQHLFNLPISTNPTNTFCIINQEDGYTLEKLENKGLGRNYGVELTYERYLHRNLYYLLSGSVFDSKYRASNGNWYNTRFSTNYSMVFTLGKEWVLSEKRKGRIIGFNIKSMYVGGMRYTPIDLQASVNKGETSLNTNQTYAKQVPDYYRLDLRVSCKRNYKKMTSTVSLDIQNTTNRKNVGGQYFDDKTGEIKYWYQTPLIPILSYKLEF